MTEKTLIPFIFNVNHFIIKFNLHLFMGQRVTKEDIKTPHFYFKNVATRNEYNK